MTWTLSFSNDGKCNHAVGFRCWCQSYRTAMLQCTTASTQGSMKVNCHHNVGHAQVISLNDRKYYPLWMLMVAIGQHCTRHCHSRVWHLHARPHLAFPKLPSHPNCCPQQGCMCKQASVSSFHRAYVRHLLFSHNSMLRGTTGHMPRRDIQATTETAPCSATQPAVQQSPDYRRVTTTCEGEGGSQRGDVSRTKIRETEE